MPWSAAARASTASFTNHLAAISPDWAAAHGVAKALDWPGGAMVAPGNAGVAQRVKLTEGSLGYVESGFSERLGLPLAWLENRAGGFIRPNVDTGQRALTGGSDAIPEALDVMITDPEGARSYPIVTYTWLLLRRQYEDPAKTKVWDGFLKHLETERDFEPVFSGKHDNSIIGVANRDYPAAAVANSVLQHYCRRASPRETIGCSITPSALKLEHVIQASPSRSSPPV